MRLNVNAKWIAAVFAMCSLQAMSPVHAQVWPSKPIKVIVPYSAGSYDMTARIVAQKFQDVLGQPGVVENRPGANGILACEFTAKSAADGYTIMLGGIGPNAINASLYRNLPYDPVRDFAPIIHVLNQQSILVVHPSIPAKSLSELLALARAKPGEISYSTGGSGSSPHLAGAMLATATGVKLTHVPYNGMTPAVTATLAGQTSMMFGPAINVMPHIRAGKLRALATGGVKRLPAMPELPTMIEAGVPNFGDTTSWFGFFAPAATPRDIVTRLHSAIAKIMNMPDVHDRLTFGGTSEPTGGSSEEFGNLVKAEITKWAKVVKDSGAKAD